MGDVENVVDLLVSQVEFADTILLNKSDLSDASSPETSSYHVRECSCGARPLLSSRCSVASRATSASRRWRHVSRHRRDAPRRAQSPSYGLGND